MFTDKNLTHQLEQTLLPSQIQTVIINALPVLYFEAEGKSNLKENKIVASTTIKAFNSNENQNKLKEFFSKSNLVWKNLDDKKRNEINTLFQIEINNMSGSELKLNSRISQQILKLWNNNNNIQSL